jgi:hypothetical protein
MATSILGLAAGSPAVAGPANDEAVTINASGGTSASTGLRIDYASAQLQVATYGKNRLAAADKSPTTATEATLANGVYLSAGSLLIGPNHSKLSPATAVDLHEWDTVSTKGGSTTGGGKVSSHAGYEASLVGGFSVDITYNYEYPSSFFNEKFTITVPPTYDSVTNPVRLYVAMDTAASAVATHTSNPEKVAITGGTDPKGYTAFRQKPGSPWAGYVGGPSGKLWDKNATAVGLPNVKNYPKTVDGPSTPGAPVGLGVNWEFSGQATEFTADVDVVFAPDPLPVTGGQPGVLVLLGLGLLLVGAAVLGLSRVRIPARA